MERISAGTDGSDTSVGAMPCARGVSERTGAQERES